MHATIGGRDLRATAVRPSGGSRGVRRSSSLRAQRAPLVHRAHSVHGVRAKPSGPFSLAAAGAAGPRRAVRGAVSSAAPARGPDHRRRRRRAARGPSRPGSLTVGILGGSCLTLLGGGSVGMEAGALQMARRRAPCWAARSLPPARGRDGASDGYPGAIGMAAAFSALFFAPLGSCMFVLELVRFDRAVLRHAPAMLAAALVAYAIARAVGIGDHIPRVALPGLSWAVAAHCLLVGLCCAVGGALFAACLRALRRAWRRRAKARPFALVAVGGLAFAGIVLACGWQAFQGTGMGLLRGALAGSAAPADFAVKAGLTVLVLGFGFKGGEIMPMFSIGALLGCSLGLATGAPAGFSAALGMAAFFAAAGRCPLTALLMGAEIFGWASLPFLLIAVAAAYAGSYDVGVFGRGAASELARVRRRARRDEPSLEEDR
ncbi:MAG: chloride channel protein [Eggerthella lenta]